MTGKCLCGKVSFVADGVHTDLHSCHCSMCQAWTGGPAFAAPVDSVSFSGEEHIGRYASSDWAERGFCRHCGSNLFYRLVEKNTYFIWMGTFDNLEVFRLAGEIYIDEKPPGYEFAGEHPRMTGAEFLQFMQDQGD